MGKRIASTRGDAGDGGRMVCGEALALATAGRAVERIDAEFITSTPAFRLFYAIRRRLGVQFVMVVLLIVEIVTTGYCSVLRRHVGDEPIAAMCKLILRDEARHIDFHRDRIAARHSLGVGILWKWQFHLLGHGLGSFGSATGVGRDAI